jgi:hypothetical protein
MDQESFLQKRTTVRNVGNPGAVLDRDQKEIAPTFETFRGRAQALYVVGDALMSTHRIRINTLALAARLPSMYPNRAAERAKRASHIDPPAPSYAIMLLHCGSP